MLTASQNYAIPTGQDAVTLYLTSLGKAQREETAHIRQELPAATKQDTGKFFRKESQPVVDFSQYRGQTMASAYRVLLSKRVRSCPDVCRTLDKMAERITKRYQSTADKCLAVYAKAHGRRVIVGVVEVTGKRVIWHDVTIAGHIDRVGEVMPTLDNKLPEKAIRERLGLGKLAPHSHGDKAKLEFDKQVSVFACRFTPARI